MPAKRRSQKSETPIDAKHRSLLEQQEALARKQKDLERLLQEAPGLKKMAAEKRRDEGFGQVSSRTRPMEVLPGRGQHVHRTTTYAPPRKLLRVERREAQLRFIALLAILATFLFFLFRTLM